MIAYLTIRSAVTNGATPLAAGAGDARRGTVLFLDRPEHIKC